MSYGRENPFAGASNKREANDGKFIGRKEDIQYIENKYKNRPLGHQYGSTAIIGLPDVGKHNLVAHVISYKKEDLYQNMVILIDIDIKSYINYEEFFGDLLFLCREELEDEDLALAPAKRASLTRHANSAIQNWDGGIKTIGLLKRFFGLLCRDGIRVICVLSNFDHANSLFREHINSIQWLRDLSGSSCQVAWIALSCKPIKNIKNLPNDISYGFFNEHPLRLFQPEDMTAYFRLLTQAGIASLTEEHKKSIIAYCGNHPYLLRLLGEQLIEDYQNSGMVNVRKAFQKVEGKFVENYRRILELILVDGDDDTKLQCLGHILFGSIDAVANTDVDEMDKYGLIRPVNPDDPQPAYVAFSVHFQEFVHAELAKRNFSFVQERHISQQDTDNPAAWSRTMDLGMRYYNRFRVTKCLATTKYNQIVQACDEDRGRLVVLKGLHLAQLEDEFYVRYYKNMLKREAEIIKGITHNNIASCYEFIEGNPPIMVMEWIEGEALECMLQQYRERGTMVSASQVVRWGIKLADALAHIHFKSIIHRDIKPANIIIRSEDNEPILIDFSIARTHDAETIHPYEQPRETFDAAGTSGYMPPEQERDPRSVTDSADIYALGMVLYEALTQEKISQSVFRPRNFPAHPTIPVPLRQILRSMLSKNPKRRPSAQELCEQLDSCLSALRKDT